MRDGRVRLKKDDRGCLVEANTRDMAAANPGGADRMQFVVILTMKEWEMWKQYVDAKDCCMGHRAPPSHAAPDGTSNHASKRSRQHPHTGSVGDSESAEVRIGLNLAQ